MSLRLQAWTSPCFPFRPGPNTHPSSAGHFASPIPPHHHLSGEDPWLLFTDFLPCQVLNCYWGSGKWQAVKYTDTELSVEDYTQRQTRQKKDQDGIHKSTRQWDRERTMLRKGRNKVKSKWQRKGGGKVGRRESGFVSEGCWLTQRRVLWIPRLQETPVLPSQRKDALSLPSFLFSTCRGFDFLSIFPPIIIWIDL